MKKQIILFFAIIIVYPSISFTQKVSIPDINKENNCAWKAWFLYPKNKTKIWEGRPIGVNVEVQKRADVKWMELYLNNVLIRRDKRYPYSWGHWDNKLRNLSAGTYQLKARWLDRCGKFHELASWITIQACNYSVKFIRPPKGKTFSKGVDLSVLAKASNVKSIVYAELYLNNKLIGGVGAGYHPRKIEDPWEWGIKKYRPSDKIEMLQNMRPGIYKLRLKIADACHEIIEINRSFRVKK